MMRPQQIRNTRSAMAPGYVTGSPDHRSADSSCHTAVFMSTRLPPLRRRRRRVNLAAIASLFSKGVATVEATVEPFAQFWDRWNEDQLSKSGPLWVALGDSVTQGIGASEPTRGYAMRTLDELQRRSGKPWRLINLSMSGARFQDVIQHQLRVMHDFNLQPAVVSALIGSNDVIWRRNDAAVIADAGEMIGALPAGTVLSRVSEAKRDDRRLGVNNVFDDAAAEGHVQLYRAWDWPSGKNMWADDKFHPNDTAYGHLHDNLVRAFERYGVTTR